MSILCRLGYHHTGASWKGVGYLCAGGCGRTKTGWWDIGYRWVK